MVNEMKNKIKSYLITDPKYYTNNPDTFQNILQSTINTHSLDMICFRDKISSNYEDLAKIFVSSAKNMGIKHIYLNTDYNLASKLNAHGVHLTSTQFDDIQKAKAFGLQVIISCHNEDDINRAIDNGADYITYSPIYKTPNKGEPKGIKNLREICKKYSMIKIIALGGILDNFQVEELEKETNAYGFASIRYFVT